MKYLLFAGILFLTACQADQDRTETEILKQKVSALEFKIDSLIAVLQNDRHVKGVKPVKQNSPGKTFSVNKNSSAYSTEYTSSSKSVKTYVRDTGSWQCMAITKKGTRCKRAARSNGYCWQHGG